MLTHLSIRHLTLVDQLELEFEPGMSVITGETGAGKSILLGALGLALGDRADSGMIAPGASKTEISATFDLTGHEEALNWLTDKELEDGISCILRRVVSADGRSRAFVNGSPMTLGELRILSEMLLDVHSQHEHQSLLKKETHRRLLDESGDLLDSVNELAELFKTLDTARLTLEQKQADKEAQSARVQLLSYQVEELSELAIKPGESEQLEQELKQLNAAGSNREILAEVQRLCDSEFEDSATSLAGRALNTLNRIEDSRLSSIREMMDSAVIQLDEAMGELSATLDLFEADPERQQTVEARLSAIYELGRKHRVSPDELAVLTTDLQTELDSIINVDADIAALEAEVNKLTAAYESRAQTISSARKKAADQLQKQVTGHLHELGMEGAHFCISLEPLEKPGRFGLDDIEFQISTIPGKAPGALSRIASGGELSRISLAIQVVTAQTSHTPTLVFDEVDVGVGGATAEIVGALLRQLGGNAQIICVTHLPQVAAQGHHHFVVSKSTSAARAETTVHSLTEEQKVDEIARMLGGVKKTEQSLAHAEEMIASVKTS